MLKLLLPFIAALKAGQSPQSGCLIGEQVAQAWIACRHELQQHTERQRQACFSESSRTKEL